MPDGGWSQRTREARRDQSTENLEESFPCGKLTHYYEPCSAHAFPPPCRYETSMTDSSPHNRLREILLRSIGGIVPIVTLVGATATFLKLGWIPAVLLVLLFIVWVYQSRRILAGLRRVLPSDYGPVDRTGFRGLSPYLDGETLHGRAYDAEQCHLRLRLNRLLILTGEPGCGKTSLINAVLAPSAREWAQVLVARLNDDPFGRLAWALRRARPDEPPDVADAVSRSGEIVERPILLVIDQFEELFFQNDPETRHRFAARLKELLLVEDIHLLLGVRSDRLGLLLLLFQSVDPDETALKLGTTNLYHLEAFTEPVAREVASKILGEFSDDGRLLRKQALDDLAAALAKDLLRPPQDPLSPRDRWTVLPAELQRIGEALQRKGPEWLTAEAYHRLGSKDGLTLEYLQGIKHRIFVATGIDGDFALIVLQTLALGGTRLSLTLREIEVAEPLRSLKQGEIRKLLQELENARLVTRSTVETGGGEPVVRYELVHDHLVTLLSEAPDPMLIRKRHAEARLAMWLNQSTVERNLAKSWIGRRYSTSMPLSEAIRLRRFIYDAATRNLVIANLRSYRARGLALLSGTIVSLAILGIVDRSNWNQLRMMRSGAAELASSLGEGDLTAEYSVWAAALARDGDLPRLLSTIETIRRPGNAGPILAAGADTLLGEGRTDIALHLLRHAVRLGFAPPITIATGSYTSMAGGPRWNDSSQVLARFARRTHESGRDSIIAIVNGGIADPVSRSYGLEQVALGCYLANDSGPAIRALRLAHETALRISDPGLRVRQLIRLSRLALSQGDTASSRATAFSGYQNLGAIPKVGREDEGYHFKNELRTEYALNLADLLVTLGESDTGLGILESIWNRKWVGDLGFSGEYHGPLVRSISQRLAFDPRIARVFPVSALSSNDHSIDVFRRKTEGILAAGGMDLARPYITMFEAAVPLDAAALLAGSQYSNSPEGRALISRVLSSRWEMDETEPFSTYEPLFEWLVSHGEHRTAIRVALRIDSMSPDAYYAEARLAVRLMRRGSTDSALALAKRAATRAGSCVGLDTIADLAIVKGSNEISRRALFECNSVLREHERSEYRLQREGRRLRLAFDYFRAGAAPPPSLADLSYLHLVSTGAVPAPTAIAPTQFDSARAEAARWLASQERFHEALHLMREIRSRGEHSNGAMLVAIAYAERGQPRAAEGLLPEITFRGHRPRACGAIAIQYARQGNYRRANWFARCSWDSDRLRIFATALLHQSRTHDP